MRHLAAVDRSAVRGVQVFHEQILAHEREARVPSRNVACRDDDVRAGAAADDDRTVDAYGYAAELLRALLDGDRPCLLLRALAFDEPDTRFHDGEQEQVQKGDEKKAIDEQSDINHCLAVLCSLCAAEHVIVSHVISA